MKDTQRKLHNEFTGAISGNAICTQEPGCKHFFADLRQLTSGRPIDETLGDEIMELTRTWLANNPLRHYRNTTPAAYGRTYLGRCNETGWEAIVMSWEQKRPSSIHGHPAFAGYFFADGVFQVELFERTATGHARLKNTVVVEAPYGFHAIGAVGCFDNHIHRITCLSPEGHSLHVYSDDALQGEVFEVEDLSE